MEDVQIPELAQELEEEIETGIYKYTSESDVDGWGIEH